MKHSQSNAAILAALNDSGFGENGPEKRATRSFLVESTRTHLTHPPFNIFTLYGMEGHCVKLFRRTWSRARIVGVDRQASAARFTKAHFYQQRTPVGCVENWIMHGTLGDYAARRDNLYRRMRDGSKYRLLTYDFPVFDMMFLDTTAVYNSRTVIQNLIDMIDDHTTTPLAVVGITLVLGSARKDTEVNVERVIRNFQRRVTRRTALIGEPMVYYTKSAMLFFALQVQ